METLQRKITIVMPAFNEAEAIGQVVAQVQEKCAEIVHEIIVVDDGSADDTGRIAAGMGCRVIHHARNRGYGAALKTGIRAAQTEYVLSMDADGQHRIEDVMRLSGLAGQHDMVIGQRTGLIHSTFWRMPGKWLLAAMANYLTRQTIPDLNSGLRLLRRELALKYLHLCPEGFSFSTTITMTFLYRGYDVLYIPIEAQKRTGKSTVSVGTGLQTIILLLRIASLFDPLRIFIPLSVIVGLIGVLWTIPYALAGRGVSVGSMLAIVTAIMLFGFGLICDQVSQLRLERFE